jgi:Tfp pilus assembly protein PilO
VIRTLESAGLALALLDVFVWLGVVRVYDAKLETAQESLESTRREWQQEKVRVAQLDRIKVKDADDQLDAFLQERVPPRKKSFSHAGRLVARLSKEANVQLNALSYRLNSAKGEQLKWLGMEVSVTGPFPSLLRFMHAVETTSDLLVVRGFSLESGDQGNLELRLTADLYVMP